MVKKKTYKCGPSAVGQQNASVEAVARRPASRQFGLTTDGGNCVRRKFHN